MEAIFDMPQLAELPRITTEGHLLLQDVDWETYAQFVDRFEESHIFLTYHQGNLEIVAPSLRHDSNKSFAAMLIEAMALEMDVDFMPCGSTTIRRKARGSGLEPDAAYYLVNVEKLRKTIEHLDFEQYPIPDLALEIEASRTLVKRLPVYAELGFPEIWHLNRKTKKIEFLLLQPSGKYEVRETSKAFPFLTSTKFQHFLDKCSRMKLSHVIHQLQEYVQQFKK